MSLSGTLMQLSIGAGGQAGDSVAEPQQDPPSQGNSGDICQEAHCHEPFLPDLPAKEGTKFSLLRQP